MIPILANIGVPMLFIQLPLLLLALAPVVVAESLWLRRRLHLSTADAFKGTSVANVVSTVIGFPVAWAILVAAEMLLAPGFHHVGAWLGVEWNSPVWMVFSVLTSFPWLGPAEHHLYWMVPVASALLLVPSYFASVWIERPICRRIWGASDAPAFNRAIASANRISYAGLFLAAIGWLCYSVATHEPTATANKPDSVNPAMALRFAGEDPWRRVTDLEGSTDTRFQCAR